METNGKGLRLWCARRADDRSVLDAICGHAPTSVGGSYGEVSLKAKGDAMAKFPRFEAGC